MDFAKYLKGDLPEEDFEKTVGGYPRPLQKLAVLTTALRVAETDAGKAAARAGVYARDTPATGQHAWIHALQPMAARMAEQGKKVQAEIGKLKAGEKDKNRKAIDKLLKDRSLAGVWKPYLDSQMKKLGK